MGKSGILSIYPTTSAVMFLSSLFLLAAATVNFLLWRNQNIHTWTVQAYIVSLFFMYIFLALSHVFSAFGYLDNFCVLIGAAAHYFFLSTFFWLSMINFDLWWKFRKLSAQSGIRRGRKLRFFIYAAASIGTPAFIIAVGILVPQYLRSAETEGWPSLEYGTTVCYLEDPSLWPYLYGPVSVILGLNLIFFFLTIHSLHVIKRTTRIATEAISTSPQYKQITLFLKLLCITGVLWNFEVISYIVEFKQGTDHKLWYWSILDVLNISQAVAIFFIFTWKRKIRRDLENEYPSFKSIFSKLSLICCYICLGPKTPANGKTSSGNERKGSGTSTQTSQDFNQTTFDVSMSTFQPSQNSELNL